MQIWVLELVICSLTTRCHSILHGVKKHLLDSYVSELFKHVVHLKLGCVAVVDAEASGFLIVGLVHFLQKIKKETSTIYKLQIIIK